MPRLVIDTNTLVSGFGWGGPPGQVVDAVLAGRVTMLLSVPLRQELVRVLRYPKLAAVFPDPERVVALLIEIAEPVAPTEQLAAVSDEPDNRVLEAAVTGQADLIVTGDTELLDLHAFQGIRIVTARKAAEWIAEKT